MKCENCGKKIDRHVKFCPHCGTEQKPQSVNTSIVTKSIDNKQSNNKTKTTNAGNEKKQKKLTNEKRPLSEVKKISNLHKWNIWASVFGLVYYVIQGLWKKGVLLASALFIIISVLSFFFPTNILLVAAMVLHFFIFGYLGNKDTEQTDNEKIWKEIPSFFSKKTVLIGIVTMSFAIFLFSMANAYDLIVRNDYIPLKEKITQHNEMKTYKWEEGPYEFLGRDNQYEQNSKTVKNYLKQYQGTWMDEDDTGVGVGILNDKIYLIDYDKIVDITNFNLKINQSRANHFSPISQLVTFSLNSATDYVVENVNPDITGVKLGLEPADNKKMTLSTHDDSDNLISENMTLSTLIKTSETFNPDRSTSNMERANIYDYDGYNDYDSYDDYEEYDDYGDTVEAEELVGYVNDNNDSDAYDLEVENGVIIVSTTDKDAPEKEEDKIKQNIGIAQSISNHISSQVKEGVPVLLEEPFQGDFSVIFTDGQPTEANEPYRDMLTDLNLW
ncbi:hypothetical protein TEHN7128_0334 [Tetragenococcus halophilus subsp. halophilus]|uniref:DUF2628 domain-containing protein n=1 Tax=Tetragenococcus halophilus TaxID=51669 RepID=UPI000CC8868A|nr:zinc-ribbon domain-containing protein [Tetragenococcus halophilus]MCO8284486.1 zinc-ribbon domain-containing protein [Tetragenococcus halophilus]GBD65931.1 hypothetical protein TEHN7116_0895 [Tetragenococcus halophilus subsp. halophilus]GBD77105.1 hypothetical protein TEHN7128_0334 [Tetragenococcus halophilus subsp. halophilus]